MAFLTMEVLGRHARARAIIRDPVSPANLTICGAEVVSRDVARVVSDVSVLCPRTVSSFDNKGARGVGAPVGSVGCKVQEACRGREWSPTGVPLVRLGTGLLGNACGWRGRDAGAGAECLGSRIAVGRGYPIRARSGLTRWGVSRMEAPVWRPSR